MKYVVRVKCVSQCMSIRRGSLLYITLENKEYDLSELSHPFSRFPSLKISDGNIIVNSMSEKLLVGEEVFLNTSYKVKTLTGEDYEYIVLGAMIIPLDPDMEDYYVECINNNERFDQWPGEFEYILGMMNELCLNDSAEAMKWYDKAMNKGFAFELIK